MSVPSPVYLFRIIHIDNLPYILNIGKLTTSNHPQADPNYIGIGDQTLIQSRNARIITLPPGGTFAEYVAFYFGPRSPMLYNIKNGFQGVAKLPQEKIIYLVSTFDQIQKNSLPYLFFDGHGYHELSSPYNNPKDLGQIDWQMVKATQWNDTVEDSDRKRRKQAELIVHNEVPVDCLAGIAVYNDSAKQKVELMVQNAQKNFKVIVKKSWYY